MSPPPTTLHSRNCSNPPVKPTRALVWRPSLDLGFPEVPELRIHYRDESSESGIDSPIEHARRNRYGDDGMIYPLGHFASRFDRTRKSPCCCADRKPPRHPTSLHSPCSPTIGQHCSRMLPRHHQVAHPLLEAAQYRRSIGAARTQRKRRRTDPTRLTVHCHPSVTSTSVPVTTEYHCYPFRVASLPHV
jgi:hypothetical protein